MHDGPNVVGSRNVLGRLRDSWDGAADDGRAAAEPRRALIPDFELYEPPPSGWWEKVRSIESEDVQFGAFIVMLCLAALLALIVLIAAITNSTTLSAIAITLGVGALFSYFVASP